jgi:hypothetical protein
MKRDTDARNPKLFKVKGSVISTDITLRDLVAALVIAAMVLREGADLGMHVYNSKLAYRQADALCDQRVKERETWTV